MMISAATRPGLNFLAFFFFLSFASALGPSLSAPLRRFRYRFLSSVSLNEFLRRRGSSECLAITFTATSLRVATSSQAQVWPSLPSPKTFLKMKCAPSPNFPLHLPPNPFPTAKPLAFDHVDSK